MVTPSPLSPRARLLRGLLAALIAVGSAAAAHVAAGHHAPHPVILLLAAVVSIPLCTALIRVCLSRFRLAAAVLISQAVLHGLFALFPHSHAAVSTPGAAGHGQHHSHQGHHHDAGLSAPAEQTAGPPSSAAPEVGSHGLLPDAGMALAHLAAAAAAYLLLRRGEVLIEALLSLLGLRPVLLLIVAALVPAAPGRPQRRAQHAPRRLADLWPGRGAGTLRGPPVLS